MHLKLLEKTNGFRKSMDVGALYFEFSDGLRIAMHRDLYLDDSLNGAKVYNSKHPIYNVGDIIELDREFYFECLEKTYITGPAVIGHNSVTGDPIMGESFMSIVPDYQPPVNGVKNQRFWKQIDNLKLSSHTKVITDKEGREKIVTHVIKRAPYRTFIQGMMNNSRTRYLTKLFYKPGYMLNNNKDGAWISVLKTAYNSLDGFLSKEFLDGMDRIWYGGGTNPKGAADGFIPVPLNKIRSVSYWGLPDLENSFGLAGNMIYDIGPGDGRASEVNFIRDCDNVYFPIKSKWANGKGDNTEAGWDKVVDIRRVDMSDPMNLVPHTYNDIKIKLNPDVKLGHKPEVIANNDSLAVQLGYLPELINTKDTLTWINGAFVQTSKESDYVMYIKGGMNFVNWQWSDVSGTEPIPSEHTGFLTAAYDVPAHRKIYTPDFDVAIFKWKGVQISEWANGYNFAYKEYRFLNKENNYRMVIDHIHSINFHQIVDENHVLMCAGGIYPRHMYDIVQDLKGKMTKIVFKINREKVNELCINALREYGYTGNTSWHVEKALPKGADFHLVQFTPADPGRKIQLNRSFVCHRNHPYPFFATFPDFRVGDMVLLDGYYDRYSLWNKNIIFYDWMEHRAAWRLKSYLANTDVERVWFSEVS